MDDYIEQNEHRANIADMQLEIRELTEKIRHKETIDKFNAFDNPTEYEGFSGNYAEILPQVETQGYEIPLEPQYEERKKIRKFYSIGGWCIIFQFAMTTGLAIFLMSAIFAVLKFMNPDLNMTILQDYIESSSILVSLNMIIYMICNVLNAFIGMKWAKIKPSSIIQTKDFGLGNAIHYCIAALFIWVAAIYIAAAINDICSKYGMVTSVDQSNLGTSALGTLIMTVYTCIIAPITEEIFFRGMLLKVFSKVNQRFAIFATAVFFGLAHGNIPQFMLAFMLGIFLANITMKHTSIIPSVIVHMFINTFSTVFGYIGEKSEYVQFISMLVLFALAIVGMIMLIVFYSGNRTPATTPKQSTRGLEIAVGSIPFCIAFVIQVIYMIYALVSNSI